jgi:hypothetical protein
MSIAPKPSSSIKFDHILAGDCTVLVCAPDDHEAYRATHSLRSQKVGQRVVVSEGEFNGHGVFLCSTPEPVLKEQISQTESHLTRRETSQLTGIRDPDALSRINMALWKRNGSSCTDSELRSLCIDQTKASADKGIERLMQLPTLKICDGVTACPQDEAYRHDGLMDAIAAVETTAIIDWAKQTTSKTVRIVVLGCGVGHELLVLAAALERNGLARKARLIGIDRSQHDLKLAKAAFTRHYPKMRVRFVKGDLLDPAFGDRLRAWRPDFTFLTHVLEHLPEEIEGSLLQDALHATGASVFLAVPLNDPPASSISHHVREFTHEGVVRLAKKMIARCAGAINAVDLDITSKIGLVHWMREARGNFGRKHFVVEPRTVEIAWNPEFDVFRRKFDAAELNRQHYAVKVGDLMDKEAFDGEKKGTVQFRQLLIKKPGTPIRVPAELRRFREAIMQMASHFRAMNPWYEAYYIYLNVFSGPMSFDAYRGLSLSCHGDQLQNLRGDCWYPPDASYIASNTLPTIFLNQEFDVSDAIARAKAGEKVNLYDYLNRQARKDARTFSENYSIYLLNPYVIHSAQAAIGRDGEYRTFFKLAFSVKRFFDNREMRYNHALGYADWHDQKTVGYLDGWLNHAHPNERFLLEDLREDGGGL